MGKIVEINSKEELEKELENEKIVLVDFYANWCGPCKVLGPILDKISKEKDVTVVKINVDEGENSSLASEKGVKGIPAVFIYKNGQQVDKFVGAKSELDIISIIEKNIESNTDEQKD